MTIWARLRRWLARRREPVPTPSAPRRPAPPSVLGRGTIAVRWRLAVQTAAALGLDPATDPLPCHWCGRRQPWRVEDQHAHPEEALTTDHVIPRGAGGRHSISNVVLACYACNQQRHEHWQACEHCARGDFCLLGLYFGITVVRRCVQLCLLRPARLFVIRSAMRHKREPKVLLWLTKRRLGVRAGSGPWVTVDDGFAREPIEPRPKTLRTLPVFNPPRIARRPS